MSDQDLGSSGVARLQAKGVQVLAPGSVHVGPEVDPDRISGDGVVIHPGCRVTGAQTVIGAGSVLGGEGPATVVDCQLGRSVQLKAGYFAGSVFLDRSSMGSGAHVREGTLLEEEANGAHCVGLKQTILLPFVTLGSLINFCDCLMAGGTSRKDHSEVGSSYIHFNFTPDGTKATPSLFGDVPRGVMLDQPRIFLGGQGGAVGPIRTGFGTVVGAGTVLRTDVLDDGMLVIDPGSRAVRRPVSPRSHRDLARVVARNVTYVANLAALQAWYVHVRALFLDSHDLAPLVHAGALRVLASARAERATRLAGLVAQVSPSDPGRTQLVERIDDVLAELEADPVAPDEDFLAGVRSARAADDYLRTIAALPPEVAASGVRWLQRIVDSTQERVAARVPALTLYGPA